MSGLCLPTSGTAIYSTSDWNIGLSEKVLQELLDIDSHAPDRHPTHSLLRFLIVSNSLDLFLDLVLELWSAFVGMYLCRRHPRSVT